MKLAILASLARDKKTGRVHGDPRPLDQVIKDVKNLIKQGEPLDPRFPILGCMVLQEHRMHRFRVDEAAAAEVEDIADGDELNVLIAANEAMQAQAEKDAATIKELTEQSDKGVAAIKELEEQLEKAKAEASAKATVNKTLQQQLDETNQRLSAAQKTLPPDGGSDSGKSAATASKEAAASSSESKSGKGDKGNKS